MAKLKPKTLKPVVAMNWCVLLTIIFIAIIFALPENIKSVNSHAFSSLGLRILALAVSIPSIIVWFIAFWGSSKLHDYSAAIADSPEGPYFNKLATGVTWLAWSLPLTAIVSHILNGIANKAHGFDAASVIIVSYFDMILPLIAFVTIGLAARGIIGSREVNMSLSGARAIMFLFGLAGISYCYFTLKAFDLTSLSSTHNPYHLPAWLMILTIIIPYLYMWFVGLLAAYEITLYAHRINGILYKRALFFLVGGLVAVIVSEIAILYLVSVAPSGPNIQINLRYLGVIAFRVLNGIGFILITFGAGKLKKIEEV